MTDDTFHFRMIPLKGIEEAFTVYRYSRGKTEGIEKKVEIQEITPQEAGNKKYIGIAIGQDVKHCVYLGMKYHENFTDKVKYYSFDPEDEKIRELKKEQPHSISIGFYGGRR